MHTPVVSHVPRGVGCPPPPGMDPRRGKGKLMCIKVRMLDDSVAVFHLGHKATGQSLFEEVVRHLNILESDYFGLEYLDGYGNKCWLDRDKSILRQITSTQSDARFYFVVKFYTSEPANLEEEYTRYLFALQIRRDLAHGELICNENTAALLVSFIVQSECGDFSSADYPHHTYLSATDFVPHQTAAFQMAVMENHRKLIGMSPADADLALLETARRCEFYGIKLASAKDIEGTDVSLAVAHMGIKVFHQLNCVSTFSWAKIRKLSFKRRRLMIKLHPESYQYYKEIIEFVFENRDECKSFWKKSVEHHAFFRCAEPVDPRRKKDSKLFSRGSSFHYLGRTQKQLTDYVREHRKRREPFQRPIRANSTARHLRSIQFNVARDGDATQVPLQLPVSASVTDRHGAYRNYTNSNGNARRLSSSQEGGQHYGLPIGNGESAGEPHRNGRHVQSQAYRPKSVHQQDSYRQSYQDRMCASDMESSIHMALPPPSQLQRGRNSAEREVAAQPVGDHDPMTMSLPNVLADPRFAPPHLLADAAAPYHTARAISGDNMTTSHAEGDVSDGGTYRMGRDAEAASCDSSQSDVGSSMSASVGGSKSSAVACDPRIYSTNFTTRRVGNVIVKRVMPQGCGTGAERLNDGNYVNGGDQGPRRLQQQPATATTDADPYYYTCYGGREASGSSVSAPSSATNRYMPVSSNFPHHHQRHTAGRLRTAVPVPIDGPMASAQWAGAVPTSSRSNYDNVSNASGASGLSVETKTANIIRPVVLSSSSGVGGGGGGASNSVSGGSVSTILRRPVLVKPATSMSATPTPSASSSVSSALFRNGATGSAATETSVAITASSSQVSSTSLVGAIISNESSEAAELDIKMVEGGTLRRDDGVSGGEAGDRRSGRGEKPKVPPKPQCISFVAAQMVDAMDAVAPLDAIFHGARELSEIVAHARQSPPAVPSTSATSSALHPPSSISIESEDVPEVKTMHLFSDEPTIPYTLTIRSINSAAPTPILAEESSASFLNHQPHRRNPLRATTSGDFPPARIHPNRKSLDRLQCCDLVHRRQLPHHDSFSAEDHSISPTSPESGNVVEYVTRRRSLSTDRYQAPTALKPDSKVRGAARRMTQPIQTNSAPSEEVDLKSRCDGSAPEAVNDSNDCPLPDPPAVHQSAPAAENTTRRGEEGGVAGAAQGAVVKEGTPESAKGVLLETDF